MDAAIAASRDWIAGSDAESCSTPVHFPACELADDGCTVASRKEDGWKRRFRSMIVDTADQVAQDGVSSSSARCTMPSITRHLAITVTPQDIPHDAVQVAERNTSHQLSSWLSGCQLHRQPSQQTPRSEICSSPSTPAACCVVRPVAMLCKGSAIQDDCHQELQQWLKKQESRLQDKASGNWPAGTIAQGLPPPAFVIMGLLN